MSGVITGGWEFVIGAYAWSAIVLIGYVISVVMRHSKEQELLKRRSNETEAE